MIEAATVVNSEMLMFYWEIGSDIVKNKIFLAMEVILK